MPLPTHDTFTGRFKLNTAFIQMTYYYFRHMSSFAQTTFTYFGWIYYVTLQTSV